jgi:hypothetical protein
VAITSEEEKRNCCVDGPIIALCYKYNTKDSSESKETLLWFVILIPFYLTNTITQLLTNTITRLTHQPSSLRLYSQTALSEQRYLVS